MLSKLAIIVLTHYPGLKADLAEFMEISTVSIGRYIRSNNRFGKLTSPSVVEKITELTGLTQEQILEKEAS